MPGVKGVPHKNRKQQPWYYDCFAYRPYQRDDNGDIEKCRILKEAYCKCSEKCNFYKTDETTVEEKKTKKDYNKINHGRTTSSGVQFKY